MVYMSYMTVMLGLRALIMLIDTCFNVMIYASILKLLYASEVTCKDICLKQINSDYMVIAKTLFETNFMYFLH